jgi:UDP-N-acetylglucosamine--N-acetylmuramyl-(pentapeptide) pyrophosphoryl-undecaprenol N-acetylglucosamine transferase
MGIASFIFHFCRGYRQAGKIIREYRPDLILALGNYLSLSVGLAGQRRQIPLILHEQNCLPGKATRILARHANVICTSFIATGDYLPHYRDKIVVTGNPLRPEMINSGERATDRSRKTLLIFGGSQGAHRLNVAMIEALDRLEELRRTLKVIHLTGQADLELVEQGYREKNFEVQFAPYENNMQDLYRQADLVIARSGALTLAELAYFGLPSILIPYPYAAEDHQMINARVLEKAGAAWILADSETNGENLAALITTLIKNDDQLQVMGKIARVLAYPSAAADIARIIVRSIPNHV